MKKLILVLVFAVWVFPASLLAETPLITGLEVSRPPLTVSFKVKDAFSKNIEEAVRSGLPTSFNFIIELRKVNRFLPDEKVGRWEFRHTVRYDSLRNEYEVVLDEQGDKTVRTRDFEEMKRVMAACSGVIVAPAHLIPGSLYELRIKAAMDPVELPFLLNYIFFFLKFLNFETDWHVHAFTA
ncbi:MAG: DUF4390 domain-containing protein [Thermodesulfobacteriota bacterium]|nr:MAG: DUF4390 domain-containing protein [Thermodesulfobacteriota bacterium]